ncbi:hypothetical protein, partial [Burkholderia cepacia]
MNPDTDLGENGRHEEVPDEQATTYVFPGVQTTSRLSGARPGPTLISTQYSGWNASGYKRPSAL